MGFSFANTWPVIKKELQSYFNSPIAYIVIIGFLVFTSVWLYSVNNFVAKNMATLRDYFTIMPIVFAVIIPAMTMRSWAEEWKMKTDELLMTLPFREVEIVVGKFLASTFLLLVMIVLTIPVPLTANALGTFDAGQILGEYLGVFLLGAAGIAIGLFISSLSRNQISAFIFGLVGLLFITMLGAITAVVDLPEVVNNILNYISLDQHFKSFSKGLIDTRDIVYFLGIIVTFLYLNTKMLVFRKWS